MNGNGKAPTSLSKLQQLLKKAGADDDEVIIQWLQYTYDLLTARRDYHKKQQVKRKLLVRYAQENLAADELESIDKQAEDQVSAPPVVSVGINLDHDTLNNHTPDDDEEDEP